MNEETNSIDGIFNINDLVLLTLQDKSKVGLILNSIFYLDKEKVYSFLVTNLHLLESDSFNVQESINDPSFIIYGWEFYDVPKSNFNRVSLVTIWIEECFIEKEKSNFIQVDTINFSTEMNIFGYLVSDWIMIDQTFPYSKLKDQIKGAKDRKIWEFPISKFRAGAPIGKKKKQAEKYRFISNKFESNNKHGPKFKERVDFSRTYYEEGFEDEMVLQHVSLDSDFPIDSLIDPDEIIFNYDRYKILIDYPFDDESIIEVEKPSDQGTSRIELFKQLQKIYLDLINKDSDVPIKEFEFTFVMNGIVIYEQENGDILIRLDIST